MRNWIAYYRDGTALRQYPHRNNTSEENKYADIDREKLIAFVVRDDDKPLIVMHIPEGGRLIYRQRVEQRPGQPDIRVWIVGMQETKKGQNSQAVLVLFEDGHIEVVNRFVEGTRWFYPPIVHPQEGEHWDFD